MAFFSSPDSSSSTQSPSIFSPSSPSPFSFSLSSVFPNPNTSSSTQSSPIFVSFSPSPFSSSSSSTVFSTASLIPSFSISAPPFPFEFGGCSTSASSPLFGMSITTAAPASPTSDSGLSSNVFGSFTSSAVSTDTTSQFLSSPFSGSSSSNSSNPLFFCSSPFCASSSSSDSTMPGLPSSSFLGSASTFKTQSATAFSFKIGSGSSKPNSIPAAGVAKSNSLGSGTASSIFSTITTTNSIPAAAAAESTITATVASSAPPTVSSPSTDLSGLSFSLSTESSAILPAQSTALLGTLFPFGAGIGEEGRVGIEGEQMRDRVVEDSVVQIVHNEPKSEAVEGLKQDQDEYVILESAGLQNSVGCEVLPRTSIVNEGDVGTSAGSPNAKFVTTDSGVAASSKEVEVEPCENSADASKVVSGDEIDASGVASKISNASLCSEVNDFTPSFQNGLIVKQIIAKYGDITTGSILKSVAAKSTFLQLVADVVHRLCNHTLDTLGHDEMKLIQTRTADAVAVGFHVDWLQKRVKEVMAAFKYKVCTIELDQLSEKIYAAKKSLAELELQQMVRKKEVTFLKAEMEGSNVNGPNLGDGLL